MTRSTARQLSLKIISSSDTEAFSINSRTECEIALRRQLFESSVKTNIATSVNCFAWVFLLEIRKIFGFHRWESVKTFICGLGRLDFKHIYALWCFKVWNSVYISSNVVLRTVFSCVVNSQDFNPLCYLYGVSVISMNFSELTCAVYEHFRTSTMWFFFFYIVCITVMLRY